MQVKCTTIAQVYTYDPIRMDNYWAYLSTGVLYLAKSDSNVTSLGLFHLLKMMTEWEEEVYEEMTLKYEQERILSFEGKVYLQNN